MAELSEVKAVLERLVDAVISSFDNYDVTQDVEVLPIGGYLWKFPSEGSNRIETSNVFPPPSPQLRDYPRKCGQCGVCWVSDREFELDHLRRCSVVTQVDTQEDTKQKAVNFGVPRRVCFQIVTYDHRRIVFQWRPVSETGSVLDHVELDARQWQEYLEELSRYARDLPLEEPTTRSVAELFKEISDLLLNESNVQLTENRFGSVLKKCGYASSLCDDNGNSLVHLAISLNLGDKTAAIVSALLNMGIDCNIQNHEYVLFEC
ncbi:IQ and ubiquitin domain-containing protein [Phytophthora nicotianae]|uniref:IQ and ubiquitin domain-containing protein n=1 Tax=Phytophthora nicotianae TaxID=4792 RepID=A0A0W8CSL3_PHYNI|nr:IQ and ubiquitin domain-containing protein [Phytophthora nicotianae]